MPWKISSRRVEMREAVSRAARLVRRTTCCSRVIGQTSSGAPATAISVQRQSTDSATPSSDSSATTSRPTADSTVPHSIRSVAVSPRTRSISAPGDWVW